MVVSSVDSTDDFVDFEAYPYSKKGKTDDQNERVDSLKEHIHEARGIHCDGIHKDFLLEKYAVAHVSKSQSFWQPIRDYIRDSYFLPLNGGYSWADELTGAYTDTIVRTLKGEKTELSGSEMYKVLRQHIQIREVPVDIAFKGVTYRFNVRVVESKPSVVGKKFRFVNFSWYANEIIKDGVVQPWVPKHTDEMSVAPLDVLRALKQRGYAFQSMMCFSLGNLSFNGLNELSDKDLDLLPKTLILNRGFTSLWKILCKFYTGAWSMWRRILFQLCALLKMSPDPENGLREHMERIAKMENGPEFLASLRAYVLEASGDVYFSGASALDKDFIDKLKAAGVGHAVRHEVYAPAVGNETQHFARLDQCVTRASTDGGEHYDSLKPVASVLADEIFLGDADADGYHSCFLVSGNRNPPDTIIGQMVPVYLAIVKGKEGLPSSYTDMARSTLNYFMSFFVSDN